MKTTLRKHWRQVYHVGEDSRNIEKNAGKQAAPTTAQDKTQSTDADADADAAAAAPASASATATAYRYCYR